MKILLDLDLALADGRITADERDRLKSLAGNQTSELAVNILIGFGVVAVTTGFVILSGGIAGLLPPGLALAAAGLGLVLRGGPRWALLGQIMLVIGTALLASGLVLLDEGSARAFMMAAALCGGAAFLAENGLLAAAGMLALAAALGATSRYQHARYTLIVEDPGWTILVFAALSIALVAVSRRLGRYERLALIAARTGALMVNFAFLVGSLWGDTMGGARISADAFSIVWALALLAAATWGWRANRRWPLVAATVFGALHFYTQFFERLGASPGAILAAGIIAVAIGYGLKRLLGGMVAP